MCNDYYSKANAILTGCNHERRPVHVGEHTVCTDCYVAYDAEFKAARKQELADWHKANSHDCDRCGKQHATRWTVGPWYLCGRCNTLTKHEHERAAMQLGGLGIFAVTGLMVDTTKWANPHASIRRHP